jgi:hypothetical protein
MEMTGSNVFAPLLLAASGYCLTSAAAAQSFGPERTFVETPTDFYHGMGDLDGDGDPDAVLAGMTSGDLTWYDNLGDGRLGSARIIDSSLPSPQTPSAFDIDVDGDLDVVVVLRNEGSVVCYENLGAGTFAPRRTLADGMDRPRGFTLADLDGDGDPDLVVTVGSNFMGTPLLVWFENLGAGSFGPEIVITASESHPRSVEAADLDGDGDLDLLLYNHVRSAVWFENLGGGAFGPRRPIVSDPGGLSGATACDIDGDGDLDALVSGQGQYFLRWFENDGAGDFGTEHFIRSAPIWFIANAPLAADVDGDGDVDAFTVDFEQEEIAWYENLGGGIFAPYVDINPNVWFPAVLSAEDMDGDGDLDLIATQAFAFTALHWYENWTGPGPVVGRRYCSPAIANSTGVPGRVRARGSVAAADQALTLTATGLPPNVAGLFLVSPQAGLTHPVMGSQGALCLSGPIGRLSSGPPMNAGPDGTYTLALDLSAIPTPTGSTAATPGETWCFQAWHRDAAIGQGTSNFTDAVAVTFQ